MATLRTLGSYNYAIAAGQGIVAATTAWIILDHAGPDYLLDSDPTMTMPTKSVLLGYDGTGAPQFGGRVGGLAAPRGLWHSFTLTWPSTVGGASGQLIADLLTNFPVGGACTIHGLDPYAPPPSGGNRGLPAMCFWDAMITEELAGALQMFFNGSDLTIKVNAGTSRTS